VKKKGYADGNGNGEPDVMERPYVRNLNDCTTGNAHVACMYNDECTEQHGKLVGLRSNMAHHATTMYVAKGGNQFECDFTPGGGEDLIGSNPDTKWGPAYPDPGESMDPAYNCEMNGANYQPLNPFGGGGLFGGAGGMNPFMMMMMMELLKRKQQQQDTSTNLSPDEMSRMASATPTPGFNDSINDPIPTAAPDPAVAPVVEAPPASANTLVGQQAQRVSGFSLLDQGDSGIDSGSERSIAQQPDAQRPAVALDSATTQPLTKPSWEVKGEDFFGIEEKR
jgi:hypothetical protein